MEKSLEIPSSEREVLDNIEIDLQRVNIELDASVLKKKLDIQRKEYPGIPEDALDDLKLNIIFQNVVFEMNSFVVYDGHIISLNIFRPKKSNIFVMPDNIGNLSELQICSINRADLESLPKNFCKLKNLNSLDLRSNRLRKLPEDFGNLTTLRYLILSNNILSYLPESFGNLSNLMNLSLENNKLSRLPESFKNLRLWGLGLQNNPLISLSNIPNLGSLDDYSFTVTNLTPDGRLLSRPFDINCNVQFNDHIYQKTGVCRDLRPLAEYYSKSTTELAIQYCNKTDSLTPIEYKRLSWEAGRVEREFLEKHFGLEHPILNGINEKYKLRLSSGYEIFK